MQVAFELVTSPFRTDEIVIVVTRNITRWHVPNPDDNHFADQ